MCRATSFIFAAIVALGLSGGVAAAQSQSLQELRAAGEATDAKLREDAKKRIQEEIERDRAVGQARAAEQRRRAGVPDEPAPADAAQPAAPAAATPATAPAAPVAVAPTPATAAAAPPPTKETPSAAPVLPAKKSSPRY